MAKKSTGIRYDEEKLNLAKKETGKTTAQQIFDYFLDSIWFKYNPPPRLSVGYSETLPETQLPVEGKTVNTKRPLVRSFKNFQDLKMACENEDDWFKLQREILDADNLTKKEKDILTTPL